MKKYDTYLIKWYGPFSSKEDVNNWEKQRAEKFNLYIFQAKKKKEHYKYYCGMTYKQTVGKRMMNHDHHIHDFENSETDNLQIWIGTIANLKAKERDVRICENIITSELAKIEVGEDHLENRTNMNPPINDVYIIHEWWKKDNSELKRKIKGSIPDVVKEVIAYYSETNALYGINRLKYIGDLC